MVTNIVKVVPSEEQIILVYSKNQSLAPRIRRAKQIHILSTIKRILTLKASIFIIYSARKCKNH